MAKNGSQNTIQAADGGFVETSAAKVQLASSFRVNGQSANGKSGSLLIDPTNFTIAAGPASQTSSGIGADTLSALVQGINTTIATAPGGAEAGDIFVNAGVNWSNGNTLRLDAARNIDFTGGGSLGGGSGSTVILNANGAGNIVGGNDIAVKADTVVLNSQTGIYGTYASTFNFGTQANNLAITNTYAGSTINVRNAGNVTVAAHVQGNLRVRSDAGYNTNNPGSITVGSVGGITGITQTGSNGNVALQTGLGGAGVNGSISLGAAIAADGSVKLDAGSNGQISGAAINVQAGTNLQIASALNSTGTSATLAAGMNAGNELQIQAPISFSNPATATLNVSGNTITGDLNTPVQLLAIKAHNLGSVSSEAQTYADQIVLRGSAAGDVFIANGKALILAADTQSNMSVRSSHGGFSANGSDLSVGMVDSVAGITSGAASASVQALAEMPV